VKIELPQKVNLIINRLIRNGYDAYAVGGCVRDSILGRIPDDWDITTSATPKEVKELFDRTIDTGIAHGTVTVMIDHEGFEVTTYRIDGEYEDQRHPKSVEFTRNLIEDLKRRDFTINAMAYNEEAGMVDAFGGVSDLDNHIIRCVGNAEDRFSEDALRMIRAIRFSAQLGFEIEESTLGAIRKLADNLVNISMERIQVELVKLMTSNHPEKLLTAYETNVTKVILPEFDQMMTCEQNNPHHLYTVGLHTMAAVEQIEKEKVLRFAMLFHDIGKPEAKTTDEKGIDHFVGHDVLGAKMTHTILRRLRFDNDTLHKVCLLVKYHDLQILADKRAVRRAMNKVGEEHFLDLLKVMRADKLAQSSYEQEEKLETLKRIEELFLEIKKDRECVSLKDLAITGRDLIAGGMEPGKQIGIILEELLQEVIEYPERNTAQYLLARAKEGREI
jgi:tRNA nucleotidyltransferase (CCA-adding enzyme)